MKICTNCGTLNAEEKNLCKNCGAILPLSSENPELKISLGSANEEEENNEVQQEIEEDPQPSESEVNAQNHQKYGEQSIFMSESDNGGSQAEQSEPSPEKTPSPVEPQGSNLPSHQNQTVSSSAGDWDQSMEQGYEQTKQEHKEFLEEIEPAPFDKSHLESNSKQTSSSPEQKVPEKEVSASSGTQTTVSISPEKKKRLEKDMKEVLSFLSEKLPASETYSEQEDDEELSKKRVQVEQKIEPETVHDILKQLLRIDKNIEASAIIKRDGEKLASAISNRISDALFGTIGQNLSMIGSDIINGLNAGSLRSISVRGTEGVLDLAPVSQDDPILKNFLLIIFSNPDVKSGMIQIAIQKISGQLKQFL